MAFAGLAQAAESFKVGFIIPMTGPFAMVGHQSQIAIDLYMRQHGNEAAGRKIEVIIKDDGGVQPEVAKRLAQELLVKEKVDVLAGFGLTPAAFAVAPLATQSATPMIVTAAGTSAIVKKSDYIVRTSQALPQTTAPLADWAAKNDIKKVTTLVSDYGPGHDAEKTFVKRFAEAGGEVIDSVRIPLQNPDFAPFLQRVKDSRPDAVFIFVPSGPGAALMKQFADKGLSASGIRLIAQGGLLEDDLLQSMGPEAQGVVSSMHYSAAHDSATNKAYVAEFLKLSNGELPNSMSVGAYDAMHLIYESLKKTGGEATGKRLLDAMKGMSWESPRGPISIDPDTRDIIQNVYIRRVENVDGQMYNVEFDKVANFKNPEG
ncbi:ABC transporter substrate-binding protein [Pusillimonas caeni]|nr:ABC transporter substrate-binding protein [Pusillimonas caeni]